MSSEKPDSQPAGVVSLADEEGVRRIVGETVMGLWDLANKLTRLHPSRQERYRVAIFGSARAKPGTFVYDEVRRIAEEIAGMGCDIVTGGGPGLMQAANEGAAVAGAPGRSIGIRVALPFEQGANPYVDEEYEHGTFFTRLHHFALTSDAFVVVPGGIGTVLELTMVWQLLQVRHVAEAPLVLVGPMWRGLVDWASASMLDPRLQLASPKDLKIPRCVDTADEAIAAIRDEHAKWKAAHAG